MPPLYEFYKLSVTIMKVKIYTNHVKWNDLKYVIHNLQCDRKQMVYITQNKLAELCYMHLYLLKIAWYHLTSCLFNYFPFQLYRHVKTTKIYSRKNCIISWINLKMSSNVFKISKTKILEFLFSKVRKILSYEAKSIFFLLLLIVKLPY